MSVTMMFTLCQGINGIQA